MIVRPMKEQTDPDVTRLHQTALELTHSLLRLRGPEPVEGVEGAAGLRQPGRVRLVVAGDSMAPLVRSGDAVWVEPVEPASLRRGDLVVVQRRSELVTHRLVATDGEGWYTKGDNRSYLDQPIARDAILGRVVTIERDDARIDVEGRRWTAVNRLVAWVSLWEACLFAAGRRVKRRLFGTTRWPGAELVPRLMAAPFRRLIRLVLRR